MKKLRKFITVSVAMMTILSMSAVVVPNAGAAAVAGDLIKRDGLSAVYYLASDGQRYVFSDSTTYFSWYNDFSGVKTISQTELESYTLGKNVTMRPGTKLIKVTTDPKVYAVEPGGKLAWVKTEAAAKALYGDNWAKRIVDVNDSFFVNSYNRTTIKELDGTAYPAGSLIKSATAADVYYIDTDGKARKITTEAALTANRLKMSDVITTTLGIPTAGTDITAAESALTDTSSGAGGTPVSGGSGLTVALASDTPVSANIPAGSPNAFLKINLTASSDGAVNVNSIKLKAYELGTATYIDSVTFYDNGVKVGTARDVNSDKEATFNFSTPIAVAAGTTKTLVVKATIEAGQTSGIFGLGIASAADVTTGGATVSGTFPVRGTAQAVALATIGTVTMSSVGTSDTSNNFGEDNILLASFNLAAANEPIIFESMRLKNGGTNTAGIVGNLRALIDGDEVVKGVELADKFANFNMANTVIAKNDTVTVEVYGDLGIGNVNNTVDLYFDDANDLVFTGRDYGYGIQVGAAGFAGLNAVSDGIVVTLAAGDVTIDMDKTATPSKDVRPGDNDVVLATIKMVSAGENATITALGSLTSPVFYIGGTNLSCNEFDAVELKDVASGAVYDVSATSSTAVENCELAITDDIALVKGVTKTFQLRVDLAGSADTNTIDSADTLQVTLEDGAFTITGDESDDDLSNNITPTSVSSAIATVKTSSLTWQTTALTTKTVVQGSKDVVIYSAGLETGASSAVTLTSVKISATSTYATAFDDNNISQLKLYVDGKLVKTVAGGITEAVVGTTAGYINFTSLDTTNRVIPAGKTVVLEVKADFSASFSPTGYIQLAIANGTNDIVAKDVDNNNVVESVSNVGTLSRSVILATVGTLKVEFTTTDLLSNTNTIVLAGGKTTSGDKYLGKLVMTTANEPIKVKTLVLGNNGTATADDILSVDLYTKAGVLVKSKAVDTLGNANFSDLNLELSADNAHEYFVGVTVKGINVENDPSSSATYDRTAIFTLASSTQLTELGLAADKAVTAIGMNSGSDITIVEDTNASVAAGQYASYLFATSTTATIIGSLLTSITNPMSNATLTNGTDQIIGKYTFNFDNGSNRYTDNTALKAQLVSLALTVATSSGLSVTNVQAYIEGDSANKTTAVTAITGSAAIDFSTLPDVSELVDGTVVIIIEADIDGAATSDFVQTKINSLAADFVYDGYHGQDGSNTSNLLLPYTEVIGAKLSN